MSTDPTEQIEASDVETSAGNELAQTMAEQQPPETPPAAPSEPEGEPDATVKLTTRADQPDATATVTTGDGGTQVLPPGTPQPAAEGTETTEGTGTGEGDDVTIRGLYDKISGGAGHVMTQKYADDGQFLRGMVHAQGRLTERDADAELGRTVRARFGSEAEMRAFLQGQPPAATPPQQQPSPAAEPVPPTFDQVRLLQQQVAAAQAAQQEPPAEVVRQLDAVNEQMQRAAYQLATDPQAFLKPHFEQQAQQVNQTIQQSQQQQVIRDADERWVKQFEAAHKGWMINGDEIAGDGSNLTPVGLRLMQYVKRQAGRGRSQAEALYYGYLELQDEQRQQPVAPTVPPVKPQGHHKPAVAAAPAPDAEELQKERLKTMDFFENMRAIWKDEEAAASAVG